MTFTALAIKPITNQTSLFVTFTCSVSGDPKPDFRWYFNDSNDSVIENENYEIIRLEDVQKENQGKHRCEAENLLTTVKSKDVYLAITSILK